MRVAVTGLSGQVVNSLIEAGRALNITILPVGRPDLDLSLIETITPALVAVQPDVIVSAAAYTAVDKAESEPALAHLINALGAGAVAETAKLLGVPIIHISTDYVFDGNKTTPYSENDAVAPIGVYGRTKREGELRVADYANHVILRTAWVYSQFGTNFVRTMLRLAEARDTVRVVADQTGNPTSALDIADAILKVANNLLARSEEADLRGVFHFAGHGDATWADLAEATFAEFAAATGRLVTVERITTEDYPTPAKRPKNSRLDTRRIANIHCVTLHDWRQSLTKVTDRFLTPQIGKLSYD